MPSQAEKRLPWRIEAFREYLTYECLQPTAAVLSLYEGELFNIRNPRIIEMQQLLATRTGKTAWIPSRSGSEDIDWNVEGDVTRNKGRVFTSMLILYPKELREGRVALTGFGKSLARGSVSKKQYYDFILTRFKYPHPAWSDNWSAWSEAGKELYPFIYLLQALVDLYGHSPSSAYLKTEEVADYLHPDPDHTRVAEYSQSIIEARESNSAPLTVRTDDIHRKISDILGFLCLTQYCYFDGSAVRLNLFDTHYEERSNFWLKKNRQNKMQAIENLIVSI